MVEVMTMDEWFARGKELFGNQHPEDWRFVCVNCGHVQSATSMMEHNPDLKLEDLMDRVYFSCEGRLTEGQGCNWTLGGLFRIHKREVIAKNGKRIPVFLFDGEQGEPEKLSESLEVGGVSSE